MVLKMGDSSSEDAKRKKRRRVKKTKDSSFIVNFNQQQQGNVTIPLKTLVSCSSSLTTKKICFWGKEGEALVGNINWYVINISIKPQLTKEIKKLAAFNHQLLHSHIEKETSTLTPILSFPMKNSPFPLVYNTFATLDSFLYSIGGLYDYPEDKHLSKNSKKSGSNLVYYFDTSCKYLNYCWKQAPSMISHRQRPQVVTVSGKLYVFGCFGKEKCPHKPCCVWAEFFDPSTGQWDSLPVPEFKDCPVVFSPNHSKMNKISKKIRVLADYKRFHKFDTENNCWSLIAKVDYHIDISIGYKPPVVVDNVLYWFDDNANAYDILKDKTFEGHVQDFSFQHYMTLPVKINDSIWDYEEGFDYGRSDGDVKTAIIHLCGRYFCLLAYLPDLEEDNHRHIHCLVIKVSKTKKCHEDIMKFVLRARVVSCQSFPIDHKMEFLDGRVMLI